MSLRTKLLVLSIVLALIPLGIAGKTMIRITRDELKSVTNDNLISVAKQVTEEIENFYAYTWMTPLQLIKKVVENKELGAKEKFSLLTKEMQSTADFVAIQISIEGESSPFLLTQDKFSDQLRNASLDPAQILELRPDRITLLRKQKTLFVGDLNYLTPLNTWLLTVILLLDENAFSRPATLSARINLGRLLNRIKNNSFTRIGSITLIDSEGRILLGQGNSDTVPPYKLLETVKNLLSSGIRTMGTELSILPSGERRLGAYAFPNGPGLGVIVEMNESHAYLGLTKMVRNFVTWLIFGFFIAIIGGIVVSISLTRPLRKLTQAVRKLSEGNFSAFSDIQIRSRDEVGTLARAFIEMNNNLEKLYKHQEEYNKTLEQRVGERTKELNETLERAEQANEKIMESIRYAKMIQISLLGNLDRMKACLPDSFFIWKPRDIVGGDIIFTESFEDSFIVAVIDCTGHGVPGAFMTMIASSGLKRIISDERCHKPGDILKRLNFIVKTSLQQDTDYALSDDGLDAAICFVQLSVTNEQLTKKAQQNADECLRITDRCSLMAEQCSLTFAGARLPLLYIHKREINFIKGDRQSIGYKRSDLNFSYTNHTVHIEKGMSFYMYSDGFTDQKGGTKDRRFGSGRFKELIRENAHLPFEIQKDALLDVFENYRGENERQDDVTVVGFGF
ncbi:SpoIIE family protein phosphatase [Desulfonema magnum]|uniref:PPM-type phosphatase and HAMP domains-containing protein n=1 Tax=Desulfonema magnum TaxID=45655 RepID=A0A975BTG9_9BACT|nr:SpoIIE family protein phosphatase [Desulfonema magnum]QTA91370.1 PPM-type phosphatase and HAMP domains-containing protein [Desulfonema magnum]